MSRWGSARDDQYVVAGTPDLVVTDRPSAATSTRYRAVLKGRSAGGYLVGHGPTPDAAAADLERVYQAELAAVANGRAGLARLVGAKR